VTYGLPIASYEDQYVQRAEEAGKAVASALAPGAFSRCDPCAQVYPELVSRRGFQKVCGKMAQGIIDDDQRTV